jgi:hypothetical protein
MPKEEREDRGGSVPNLYHPKERLLKSSRDLNRLGGRIVFKDGHFIPMSASLYFLPQMMNLTTYEKDEIRREIGFKILRGNYR